MHVWAAAVLVKAQLIRRLRNWVSQNEIDPPLADIEGQKQDCKSCGFEKKAGSTPIPGGNRKTAPSLSKESKYRFFSDDAKHERHEGRKRRALSLPRRLSHNVSESQLDESFLAADDSQTPLIVQEFSNDRPFQHVRENEALAIASPFFPYQGDTTIAATENRDDAGMDRSMNSDSRVSLEDKVKAFKCAEGTSAPIRGRRYGSDEQLDLHLSLESTPSIPFHSDYLPTATPSRKEERRNIEGRLSSTACRHSSSSSGSSVKERRKTNSSTTVPLKHTLLSDDVVEISQFDLLKDNHTYYSRATGSSTVPDDNCSALFKY